MRRSEVRLQFDPDHDAQGHAVERRAVQLGLRGEDVYPVADSGVRAHLQLND